ncbi:mTERF protein [Trifolium pratense]|uniref:mTERF protein n=1 Tax=Trifolium pratense TaxID=57577 RepID=A0A2K3PIC1_TRIPR|nr:mTERF protein [Trifolium pratense]
MVANINLMSDFGVCDSGIARLFLTGPSILGSTDLIHALEEVKCLGFDPSTSTFVVALVAKKGMTKKLWNEKVDAFRKWGWSDEDVIEAFRRQPHCMLTSIDKINSVMSYWVNQLGWDATAIVKQPTVFGSSLERRIVPRATTVIGANLALLTLTCVDLVLIGISSKSYCLSVISLNNIK